jgi:transposase
VRREEIEAIYRAGPDAVAALFAGRAERIAALEAELDELKRLMGRNSNNSSMAPSKDSARAREQRGKKRSSGKKQGGEPGHPGRHRQMVAAPDRVEHWPSACRGCGAGLTEEDAAVAGEPVCHQVSEVIVRVEVTEHHRMRLRCDCGTCTLAELPDGVPAGAFGPGVQAAVASLCAARVGRRETVRVFSDLFGLTVSLATVQALLEQSAIALEDPYLEILHALDTEPVCGADETSWPQAGQGQWLSVSQSERMALFQIAKRRDRDAAKALLGERPEVVIVTDRHAVYLYVDDTQRQMLLAHVARDLVALGERNGAPGKLGRALSRELGRVFHTRCTPPNETRPISTACAQHRSDPPTVLSAARQRRPLARTEDPPVLPRTAGSRDRAVDLHPRARRARHEQRLRACAPPRR